MSAFAAKGIFQGRVVEGTKREAGKYIYISARPGYLRRVNIQNCRVRFDAGVPASQRVRSASEFLRDSAEVRVTAEQRDSGEWVAIEVVILKVPEIDRVRLLALGHFAPFVGCGARQEGLVTRRTLVVGAPGSVTQN